MNRSKEETERLVADLNALIHLVRLNPVLAGWLLEKQIELKREIMEGEEYRCR